MIAKPHPEDDARPEAEAEDRFRRLVGNLVTMPHKPHKPKDGREPKAPQRR